jgi:hypothetical protein
MGFWEISKWDKAEERSNWKTEEWEILKSKSGKLKLDLAPKLGSSILSFPLLDFKISHSSVFQLLLSSALSHFESL